MADITDLDSYAQLVQTLSEARDTRDAQRQAIAAQLSAFQGATEALAKAFNNADGESAGAEASIQRDLEVFLSELGQLKPDSSAALAELAEAQQRLVELESALAAAEKDLSAGREQIKQLEVRESSLNDRLAELESALQAERDAAKARIEADSTQTQRIEELELALSEKSEALEERTAALERVQEEQSALSKELDALQEASGAAASLEAEVERLKAESAALEKAAQEAQEAAQSAAERTAELESALEEAQAGLASATANAVDSKEFARVTAAAEEERRRANMLEERLKDEMAKGTKAALATQLAEAIKESEENREHARVLRQELERMRRMEQGASDIPTQLEQIKAVWRAQDGSNKLVVGEILKRAGICSEDQIQEALAIQKETPSKHIGTILIEHRFASEEAVSQARACQCEVEFITFTEDTVDPAATELLNQRLALQHTCIPIGMTEDAVVVAIANPMDLVAIEDIERSVNRRVDIVVGTPSAIHQAIERHYWEPV